MLLILRSLCEQQASGAVVVTGEGVSANPAVGTGDVITTARGGVGKRRRKPRSRQRDYWTPVRMPVPVPITVIGEGVACRPRIGTGTVQIEVGLSDDEVLAIFMMAADETPTRRKMRILERAVAGSYSRDALAENCVAN